MVYKIVEMRRNSKGSVTQIQRWCSCDLYGESSVKVERCMLKAAKYSMLSPVLFYRVRPCKKHRGAPIVVVI